MHHLCYPSNHTNRYPRFLYLHMTFLKLYLYFGWIRMSAGYLIKKKSPLSVWNEGPRRFRQTPLDSVMIEASHPWESKCKLTRDEPLDVEYNLELCLKCLIILSFDVWRGGSLLEKGKTPAHLLPFLKIVWPLTTAFPTNVHFSWQ